MLLLALHTVSWAKKYINIDCDKNARVKVQSERDEGIVIHLKHTRGESHASPNFLCTLSTLSLGTGNGISRSVLFLISCVIHSLQSISTIIFQLNFSVVSP